jgi:hypothetical protein
VKAVDRRRWVLAGRLAQPLAQPRKNTRNIQRRSRVQAGLVEGADGAEQQVSMGAATVAAGLAQRVRCKVSNGRQ